MRNRFSEVFRIQGIFVLKLFLFWMMIFLIQKIIFLAANISELSEIPFSEILIVFPQALLMDTAAASFLIALPLLLLCLGMCLNRTETFWHIIRFVNILLIIANFVIFFSGLGLYKNWGTKINSKALSLIMFPKESFAIIFNKHNILYFVIFILFIIIVIYLLNKILTRQKTEHKGILFPVIITILFTGILFIGARGGVGKYPLKKSRSFFSKHSVLNATALNDVWNFINVLSTHDITNNPYIYNPEDQVQKIIDDLYAVEKDTTEFFLNTTRPNIVVILLESFSADAIACLGGQKGIAPNFDKLASEGLLFTNFYATGFRTDQGFAALLSSFPAQPKTSIVRNFEKFYKLPNLITKLNQYGYYSIFYFGGDPTYANTDSYLTVAGIDKIFSENDIPHNRRTDWGAYDEDVFRFMVNHIEKNPQPFFALTATLTNHEFFEADVEKIFPGKSEHDLFCNTAHYTDKVLFEFLKSAKNKPWYSNTLFIITADHAHRQPLNRAYNEPQRHHIPLLFFGEVLKPEFKGKKIDKPSSHVDIAATLLSQLNIDSHEFLWSKNLMNPYSNGFAFYTFDEGLGYVNDSLSIVYDHNLKKTVRIEQFFPSADTSKAIRNGKALLQKLFSDYIAL